MMSKWMTVFVSLNKFNEYFNNDYFNSCQYSG